MWRSGICSGGVWKCGGKSAKGLVSVCLSVWLSLVLMYRLLTVGVWMSALIVVSGWIPRKCCGLAYEVCVWCVGLPLFGFWT